MEMAGIVCYTGAGIIKCARELIEQIGNDKIFVSEHFNFLFNKDDNIYKSEAEQIRQIYLVLFNINLRNLILLIYVI